MLTTTLKLNPKDYMGLLLTTKHYDSHNIIAAIATLYSYCEFQVGCHCEISSASKLGSLVSV